jgi:hypothetical protein
MRERIVENMAGKSVEEQLSYIGTILSRLNAKSDSTQEIVSLISPSPVYGYIAKTGSDGVIFKFLVPADGKIKRACLAIEHIEGKDPAKFTIEQKGIKGLSSKFFETTKNLIIEDFDIPVFTGDMLSLTTQTPEIVSGLYVTMVYEVAIK